jgi:hypothetical protein
MEKFKSHFKNNFAIYAVLIASILVIVIAMFATRKDQGETVDTSMFRVVTVKEVLNLFKEEKANLLVISTSNCAATIKYVDSLKIAQAKYGYNTYYLELDNIDYKSKDFQELLSKLDMEYNFNNKIDKFSSFIGSTPMTVIIKNKKMVHGYIGSMSIDTLYTITSLYGVSSNEEN